MYARASYTFRAYAFRAYALGDSGAAGGPAGVVESLAFIDDFVAIMIYNATIDESMTLSDGESTVVRMPVDETIMFSDSFFSRKGWIPEIPLPLNPWTSE